MDDLTSAAIAGFRSRLLPGESLFFLGQPSPANYNYRLNGTDLVNPPKISVHKDGNITARLSVHWDSPLLIKRVKRPLDWYLRWWNTELDVDRLNITKVQRKLHLVYHDGELLSRSYETNIRNRYQDRHSTLDFLKQAGIERIRFFSASPFLSESDRLLYLTIYDEFRSG